MKNYVAKGDIVPYTVASTAITSGQARVVGSQVMIAQANGNVGEEIGMLRRGVVSYAKQASLAIAQGARVYLDTGADEVDTTNTNTFMGYAYRAALAADTTVDVILAAPGE